MKRYNSINDHLKARFGARVYKVSLETGCGCPNRDGALGRSGCIYCNESSYHPATHIDGSIVELPIREQLIKGIEYVRQRHGAEKFIAYFQRGSNTYGPLKKLASIYNDAINHPDVVGLAVSTRPDCMPPAMVDVLEGLARRTFLWVELGLQSAHDDTLSVINRGHTAGHFTEACEALEKKGIPVCAHVIVGLPGETKDRLIETARFLNEHRIWGVKIHNLHILKDTQLATLYNDMKVIPLTLESYAELVAEFLEHLSPDIIVHRVGSHSPRSLTVVPDWSINKLAIFNAVEAELAKRDSRQGKRY